MDDDLEDYDFTPTKSSNLASLFGANETDTFGDVSLIYTAPKQPKSSEITEAPVQSKKPENSILCAQVVAVWKLSDSKYVSIGKLGLAILSNEEQKSHQIILYKTKNNILMKTSICSDFELISSKENFASFYDSSKNNWLIKSNNANDFGVITKIIRQCGGSVIFKQEPANDTENIKKGKPYKVENNHSLTTDNETKHDDLADNRANILNRIAKLGQSMLPVQETKNESVEEKISTPSVSENNSITTQTTQSQSHVSNQISNIPNTVPTLVMGTAMSYDPLSILFSETRSQNTEVRINLSQISEKLNQVLRLVEPVRNCESTTNNEENLKSKVKALQLRTANMTHELQDYEEKYKQLQLEFNKLDIAYRTAQEQLEISKSTQSNIIDTKVLQENTEIFTSKIKQSMNEMFNNIQVNFQDDQQYNNVEINNVIAQNMKRLTKKIIQDFQEVYNLTNNI